MGWLVEFHGVPLWRLWADGSSTPLTNSATSRPAHLIEAQILAEDLEPGQRLQSELGPDHFYVIVGCLVYTADQHCQQR